jgi:hypothetical protein
MSSGLTHKYWTRLKRLARDKHSSLFFYCICDKEKKVLLQEITKLFPLSLTLRQNKLEHLSFAILFHLVWYYILEVRPGANTTGVSLWFDLALITIIRLGCKDLPGANTLAYFPTASVTKEKKVILTSRVSVKQTFSFISDPAPK